MLSAKAWEQASELFPGILGNFCYVTQDARNHISTGMESYKTDLY